MKTIELYKELLIELHLEMTNKYNFSQKLEKKFVKSLETSKFFGKDEISNILRAKEEWQKVSNIYYGTLSFLIENAQIPNNKNYKENLKKGKQGYDQLNDYLIPIIKEIKRGINHTTVFHKIKDKLSVEYATVSAECTTRLKIKLNEFLKLINDNEIKMFLKKKFPNRKEIDDEL